MSYFDALKNGYIPEKNPKNKKPTPYDDYIAQKSLKVSDKQKNVTIIKPSGFDDIEKIIDGLKKGLGAIADLSGNASQDAQRMLDFLCGAVYALDGKIERVENKIFVMTPKNIDIINKLP